MHHGGSHVSLSREKDMGLLLTLLWFPFSVTCRSHFWTLSRLCSCWGCTAPPDSAAQTTANVSPLKPDSTAQLCPPWPSVSAGDWELDASSSLSKPKERKPGRWLGWQRHLRPSPIPRTRRVEGENRFVQDVHWPPLAHSGSEWRDKNDVAQTGSLY